MNYFKSHFWYNKSQRNGILFLIFIILVLQIIYVYVDFSPADNLQVSLIDMDKYQNQIDSLKRIKNKNRESKIFTFNPNYLSDFKAYQFGMKVKEIDRLFAYREKDKFVNSASEFQKVTGVSDSLLQVISPYFKFPEWVKEKPFKKSYNISNTKKESMLNKQKQDLNLVTSDDLKAINGIGEKLSKRIISYRSMLQGFSTNEQLYEVYYLQKDIADKILQHFQVMNKPKIKKVNINQATFKEILHLPYIDYALTKKLFQYRNEIGEFSTLQELKKIDSFPLEKYDRIALYLTAD